MKETQKNNKSLQKGKQKKSNKKQQIKQKNHLTIVELSCAILILLTLLSMSIIGFSNLISKNKFPKSTKEEIAVKATKKYLKGNKDQYPKIVGEWTNISLNTLNKVSLLSKDIELFTKKSCLDKSYVRIYKYNDNKYSYIPYIYCNGEEPSNIEIIPSPTIEAYFLDSENNIISNKLLDTKKDKLKIYLNGGINNDSSIISINSYSYTISIKTLTNKEWQKIYTTGNLITDENTVIDFTEDLNEFITTENVLELKVDIKVTNIVGKEKQTILESKVKETN